MEAKTVTLIATVSGFLLPKEIDQLILGKARIFRNPAIPKEKDWPPVPSPNAQVYDDQGTPPKAAEEYARYLIEIEIVSPEGKLGQATIHGEGRIAIAERGLRLAAGGTDAVASVAIPVGGAWDTPLLMQQQFDRAMLPLRLKTQARILAFPVQVATPEFHKTVIESGLKVRCRTLPGNETTVILSLEDCAELETLAHKLNDVDLSELTIPMSLFSEAFYEADDAERALNHIVMLESLLSESQENLSFKLALRISCLTSSDHDRWETYAFAKRIYSRRSDVLHGKKKAVAKARAELAVEVQRIENLARRSLTMACLFEVDPIAFDDGERVTMRDERSIDRFILTRCMAKSGTTPLDSFKTVGILGGLWLPCG